MFTQCMINEDVPFFFLKYDYFIYEACLYVLTTFGLMRIEVNAITIFFGNFGIFQDSWWILFF